MIPIPPPINNERIHEFDMNCLKFENSETIEKQYDPSKENISILLPHCGHFAFNLKGYLILDGEEYINDEDPLMQLKIGPQYTKKFNSDNIFLSIPHGLSFGHATLSEMIIIFHIPEGLKLEYENISAKIEYDFYRVDHDYWQEIYGFNWELPISSINNKKILAVLGLTVELDEDFIEPQ